MESQYRGLYSDEEKQQLYRIGDQHLSSFENPVYCDEPKSKSLDSVTNSMSSGSIETGSGTNQPMRTRDFLASIPSFADFTDDQLTMLEKKSVVASFPAGAVIFKQGDPGDVFYVINKGSVDVLIQESKAALKKGERRDGDVRTSMMMVIPSIPCRLLAYRSIQLSV
jgi:hypothetical protein